jgi:hypothetical protein
MAKRKIKRQLGAEHIANSIYVVRGHSVMLDVDLAVLYGVETRVLLQAVKRNIERFPDDFMLQIAADEWTSLRSQIVISKVGRGGRRYTPYAFTEQGVAMLSSVLSSSRAIAVNIEIMRTFVRMRTPASSEERFTKVERRLESTETAVVGIWKSIGELKHARETRSIERESMDDGEQ